MDANTRLRELVDHRLGELMRLSDGQVRALPQVARNELPDEGIVVAEYHDVLQNGDHKLVVQAAKDLLGGIYTAIEVAGFVLVDGHIRRPLTKEETWDYI